MEDDGFFDDSFIDDMAREFVAKHGLHSVPLLRERAEIAAAAGDHLSAQAWQDIAAAAAQLTGMAWDLPEMI